jgi:hypothetical protein
MASRKRARDEFPIKVRRQLAERVGGVCSYCAAPTSAPSDERSGASNNVGFAAHITAAAPGRGARRYDPSLSAEQRASYENGIWLCGTCAKKIDGDASTFTVEALQDIKKKAEQLAKARHGKPPEVTGSDARLTVIPQKAKYDLNYKAVILVVDIENTGGRPITIKRAELEVKGHRYSAVDPPSHMTLEGVRWLDHTSHKVGENDGMLGAWYFGHGIMAGGETVRLDSTDTEANLRLTAVGKIELVLPLTIFHPPLVEGTNPAASLAAAFGLPPPEDDSW